MEKSDGGGDPTNELNFYLSNEKVLKMDRLERNCIVAKFYDPVLFFNKKRLVLSKHI